MTGDSKKRTCFYPLCLVLFLIADNGFGAELGWHPVPGPLLTRWSAEVNPTNAHSEYPRPQLTRPEWLNLNGLWDFAIQPMNVGRPTNFQGQILVPFPIESALSGVGKLLPENSELWYRRKVSIPSEWAGRPVRLQFGAVNWRCRVWVNGREVGLHTGDYASFAFDITRDLHGTGEEEILVAVANPLEGDQPRGKQSRTPEGIFYTASSGIWQTLWLEPVAPVCIDGLKFTPDLTAQALRIRVAANSLAEDVRAEVVASSAGVEAGRVTGFANEELRLPLSQPRWWSPEDPFLYDLTVTLKRGDKVLDRVGSYFGWRQVALLPDKQRVTRIALNGRFPFEIGVLDQGFWPDGLYTAPTDAAMKSDLEFAKQAGFNLIRKHVKVEPARWYYWCDKLGLLVWQDMPSANNATPQARQVFETELYQMVNGLNNHPSIIMWVLFNEGWGQYDTERLTRWVKALDSSRLVSNASGWTDTGAGDIVDMHIYPGPDAPEPETRRASVLGEFGGLGFWVEHHSWSANNWSYKNQMDLPALQGAYERLWQRVWDLHDRRGLSAAVYTQITDVESECNGLMTYDRAQNKIPADVAAAASRRIQQIPPGQLK